MRTVYFLLLSVFLVCCSIGFSYDDANAKKEVITCASGTTGGGFYLLGSGMSTILQRNISNVVANNQSTGGGPENVRLVGSGKATVGLAGGDQMYYGYKGGREFKKAYKDIRLLVGTYVPSQHMVVKSDSKYKKISDLDGKRITTTPGFNADNLTPAILKMSGVDPDNVDIQALSFSEAIDTFIDGKSDAFFLAAGAPHPLIDRAFSSHDLRCLTMDDDNIDKMADEYSYWVRSTIPEGTYKGQKQKMSAMTSPVAWITNVNVSDELAYKMTEAVIENSKEYKEIYRLGGEFNKDNVSKAMDIIPLHPGAKKYYKENGMMD